MHGCTGCRSRLGRSGAAGVELVLVDELRMRLLEKALEVQQAAVDRSDLGIERIRGPEGAKASG